jgi:drug/metabolite transporter (DMT)-like permease
MKWLAYTLFAAAMLAAADSLMKLASGRLSNSLALTLYGAAALSFGGSWLIFQWWRGDALYARPLGLVAGFGVGIAFSLVTLGMYLAFGAGAPISRASPIVRAGGLVLAAAGGLVILREPITWRYALGMVLTLTGIYLIVSR